MMLQRLIVSFVLLSVCYGSNTNVVNRVHLIDHDVYMFNVIQEVINTLEERGWCNLKLPDVRREINETVFAKDYIGTVTLKNGFVASIQNLNVRRDSLQQSWLRVEEGVRLQVRGLLRMEDVTLGYDVEADLEHKVRHYTGTVNHELVEFLFQITKFPMLGKTSLEVIPSRLAFSSTALMTFLPRDSFADILTTMLETTITEEGLQSWSTEVFQPIFQDLYNRLPFPRYCYNCPTPDVTIT